MLLNLKAWFPNWSCHTNSTAFIYLLLFFSNSVHDSWAEQVTIRPRNTSQELCKNSRCITAFPQYQCQSSCISGLVTLSTFVYNYQTPEISSQLGNTCLCEPKFHIKLFLLSGLSVLLTIVLVLLSPAVLAFNLPGIWPPFQSWLSHPKNFRLERDE